MATVFSELLEVTQSHLDNHGNLVTTSWTSSSGGAYTEAVTLRGWLARVDFIPGAGGSQPTSAYDVTLIDANGLDVLAVPNGFIGIGGTTKTSIGADLSNSAVESYPEPMKGTTLIRYLNGTYTITIANAGNAKSGTIVWTIKNR